MTVLSKSFRIPDFGLIPDARLNDQFFVSSNVFIVIDNLSTIFKTKGSLSLSNKQEIQKIRLFAELEENWDSYEAQRIATSVISRATRLVECIDSLDEDVYFTSPGPNGEIMVQLKKGLKEVEIILYEESSAKYVTFQDNKFKKQGVFSLRILPEIIEWINV